ncbi:hypothetical protein TNIN_226151 [Trichonephila inaurata madagascariensis]|uniref:Uncharacterized protein n=1 Tax=Trichonephila inaurata madagascariensis TaxID=2747483 RepID=A0A8X7BV25_9ARAC|nr:hypothetical protein TNIN_226121 [Trichonephila inaurata madagascariensis]GFY44970.1 hypothetical protein TNIN_226151 [Trichonephila inaurata madagascariensis]
MRRGVLGPMTLLILQHSEGGPFGPNVTDTSETKRVKKSYGRLTKFSFLSQVYRLQHNLKSIVRESPAPNATQAPELKCFFLLVVKDRKILGHCNCAPTLEVQI